ncbi:MAG TPA: restriction endonuclease subunit S, partial [Ktedonobacterales bacterium]
MPDPDATAALTTTTTAADAPRPLPDGWRWARLGDVCETQSGGTPVRGHSEYYGGNIAWAKIEDLTQSGMYIESTAERITINGLENSSARLLPPGTVLLAMYGSIGTASITRCSMTTNQAIIGCKFSEELLPEILWYWLARTKGTLVAQG